jgi:phosphopantetheine adenylyltransferase
LTAELEYDLLHLLVRVLAVDAGTRAASAVGNHHAGEPHIALAEALGNTVVRHDLDVVLVSCDTEVGGSRQRGRRLQTVGNEYICVRIVEFHRFSSKVLSD